LQQNPEIASVSGFFILTPTLIQFTGCYSTRNITVSDIKASDKYDIHSKNSTYPILDNAFISDSILSGTLYLGKINYVKGNVTNIYVLTDSVIKIDKDLISIPTNRIIKIEQKVYDPDKTKTLVKIIIIPVCAATIALIIPSFARIWQPKFK
jgi:hypothetical protein